MQNKEKNFISALLYVHNAESTVEQTLSTLMQVLETHFEHSEIICINDFSTDASTQIIQKVSQNSKSTSITILNMSYFHGVELAMNAGMDLAIGDFVLEFDTSFMDYDPTLMMQVYQKALQGFDIVSAVPNQKSKYSYAFYALFERFSNIPMQTERFRILSRRVVNRVHSMNKTIPYRKAVYANCGLKTTAISFNTQSHAPLDKHEKRFRKTLAIDALLLFTDVGFRFSFIMTALMMAFTVFMVLYSLGFYFAGKSVAGWATIVLFLSVAFFALFGLLSIIIKYLQLLINLVFKRKTYSFESIQKLTK